MLESIKYKFSRKENNKYFKLWKCTIPKEQMIICIDKIVNEKLKDKVKIDGFRPGKAPLDVIKKNYPDKILSFTIRELVNASILEIVKNEEKCEDKLAISPEVNFQDNIEEIDINNLNKDFCFLVSVYLKPNINLKLENITIEENKLKFSKDEEEKEIKRFLKNHTTKKLIEDENHLTQNEDVIEISFTGKIDDKEIEGGSAESYNLELGSQTFIPGFEEQLINKKKGEFVKVQVKFPADYQSKDLADKNATFDVVIKNIYKNEFPELTEEFLKKLNFNNIEDFKEKIFKRIYDYYGMIEKNVQKDNLYKKIIDKTDIEIAKELIEKEVKSNFEHKKQELQNSDKKDEKFDEKEYLKKIKKDIEFAMKKFYINRHVITANSLQPSENTIKDYLLQIAIRDKVNPKDIQKKFDEDEDFSSKIIDKLSEEAAFDFIYSRIIKKSNEMSLKDFEGYLNKVIQQMKDQ